MSEYYYLEICIIVNYIIINIVSFTNFYIYACTLKTMYKFEMWFKEYLENMEVDKQQTERQKRRFICIFFEFLDLQLNFFNHQN